VTKTLDASYYEKRRQGWLADDDTRAEYERAQSEIEQIDAVIRSLDELREDAGMSKAELARRVGRNPARQLGSVVDVFPVLNAVGLGNRAACSDCDDGIDHLPHVGTPK
jgi:N-acyl-D-aspartate/D-glutamate deacylase